MTQREHLLRLEELQGEMDFMQETIKQNREQTAKTRAMIASIARSLELSKAKLSQQALKK